ncbi:MAG: histidinol-phosphatase HisJ family protein [Ruminococcaceae bacterium]|nr:histidinol-phosphatase HisJ family protein [Oscillospiraceae bacterium]
MKNVDLHIHTTYSDGNNTPNEIVEFAIKNGIDTIGFSDHSYTAFDQSYCIKKADISAYKNEIIKLKKKYKDKINILLGIEQDYYSVEDTSDYEFVIGSVHYIKVNGEFLPVDESKDILISAVDKYFSGNIYALIEEYYNTVSDVVNKTNANIIGHIDLISKFNENNDLFDENDERYVKAYKKACDSLIKYNKLFEINTGAISRGYRSTAYPSSQIYKYLKSIGARFILSSDSHSKDTLCYQFDVYKNKI